MKSKTVFLITFLGCVILFGGISYYAYKKAHALAEQLEQKIDTVLEQNEATINGALDSYNFTIAQKDEQIKLLVAENDQLKAREDRLLEEAAQQEEAVQPILEQYPEVAKLVFTLKETISTLQADNANLRQQLSLTQEQLHVAKTTIDTLVEQNGKLVLALQEVRVDLRKALSIGKKPSTIEQIATWSFRGLVVYGVLK